MTITELCTTVFALLVATYAAIYMPLFIAAHHEESFVSKPIFYNFQDGGHHAH